MCYRGKVDKTLHKKRALNRGFNEVRRRGKQKSAGKPRRDLRQCENLEPVFSAARSSKTPHREGEWPIYDGSTRLVIDQTYALWPATALKD